MIRTLKRFWLLLLAFIPSVCIATTIVVTRAPSNTKTIYVAGTFNQWNPRAEEFQLKKTAGRYTINIVAEGEIGFKFTQGSWAKVETNNDGSFRPNRVFKPGKPNDTIYVSIEAWATGRNIVPASTAQKNVVVIRDFYMPQLDKYRTIRILLPVDYKKSSKHYPVIYMQDGQNLFDETTNAQKSEWGIDETLNGLEKNGGYGCIVVGIDNGGGERLSEYSPYNMEKYGEGRGNSYAEFIANTLKPFVDRSYRTLSIREYTAVGGSSMGAVIAQYIALRYQDKFGKALLFSPAYQTADSNYFIPELEPWKFPLKAAMVSGFMEGSDTMVGYNMHRMRDALLEKGLTRVTVFDTIVNDGAHSEWFWKREFETAFKWLMGEWKEIEDSSVHYSLISSFAHSTGKVDISISLTSATIGYCPVFDSRKFIEFKDTLIKENGRSIVHMAVHQVADRAPLYLYVTDGNTTLYKYIRPPGTKKYRTR